MFSWSGRQKKDFQLTLKCGSSIFGHKVLERTRNLPILPNSQLSNISFALFTSEESPHIVVLIWCAHGSCGWDWLDSLVATQRNVAQGKTGDWFSRGILRVWNLDKAQCAWIIHKARWQQCSMLFWYVLLSVTLSVCTAADADRQLWRTPGIHSHAAALWV